MPSRRHLEDAADHRRFALFDDQLLSGHARHWNRVVAEAAPARVLAAKHETFEAAVSLLGQLLHVEAVHHAVDSHKDVSLLILGVDALAHSDQPDTSEVQPLENAQRILRVASEAAAVVEQDDIEGAGRRQRRIQQATQTRAVRADAAECFIDVDVFFEKDEPASMGILAANPKLILNRAGALEVAGIAGIGGTTQDHGSSPSYVGRYL